jgi:serine/threonine protein kinase
VWRPGQRDNDRHPGHSHAANSKQLGKGTFGSVYKANHLMSDPNRPHEWNRVAVKLTSPTILDKRSGQLATYDHIEKHCQEIKTLMRLGEGQNFRSSSVLFLFEYFWTYRTDGKGELVLVTELLGQELDQWRQQQVVFHESSARSISATLVSALEFMHERQVVHRDLKLQNVLFRKNGDYRSLKIVDFGLAKVLDGSLANDFCGSLGYISPEMYLNKPYSYEVDMFAMGVIIFRLLSGIRPFASTNSDKLKSDTVNLRYKIQGKVWENVSPEALKLVRKLLIGREERLTAVQAVDHEWFNVQEESVLNPDYGQTQGFNAADGYSQPIVQSQAPEDPHVSTANANRFWLDGKLDLAVNILLSYNLYVGRIIESSKEEQGELIFLEEIPSPSMRTLPAYVARLPTYTERECRRICREAAQIVQILHNAKMAHRNIHMNNFVVDKNVRLCFYSLFGWKEMNGCSLTSFCACHANIHFGSCRKSSSFGACPMRKRWRKTNP